MTKNIFYLILFLSLISLILFALSAFSLLRTEAPESAKVSSPSLITPTPSPTPTTTEGEIDAHYYDEDVEKLGVIIQKLPYSGKSFRLSYDYDRFGFDANIDPENEKEGNLEFDKFLKENGLDRSKLTKLKVTSFPM